MRFITEPKQLIIELEGLEKVWGLKSRLAIPRADITEVDFRAQRPVMQDFSGWLRVPGTAIPWYFLAGTYRRKGEKEFWYVRMREPGLLIIEIKPEQASQFYDRLRVSCDPETAQQIADWKRGASA